MNRINFILSRKLQKNLQLKKNQKYKKNNNFYKILKHFTCRFGIDVTNEGDNHSEHLNIMKELKKIILRQKMKMKREKEMKI